jgi:hypothetical protein
VIYIIDFRVYDGDRRGGLKDLKKRSREEKSRRGEEESKGEGGGRGKMSLTTKEVREADLMPHFSVAAPKEESRVRRNNTIDSLPPDRV